MFNCIVSCGSSTGGPPPPGGGPTGDFQVHRPGAPGGIHTCPNAQFVCNTKNLPFGNSIPSHCSPPIFIIPSPHPAAGGGIKKYSVTLIFVDVPGSIHSQVFLEHSRSYNFA